MAHGWFVAGEDGASLHLVGSVLNHKDQKTTAGYAYFQTKERHKALDKHGGTLSTSHRGSPRPPQTPGNGHPLLRPISRSIAARFTPLREKRSISSYGRRRHELVSKRLGISDVGLAKVCRRANIPSSDRGYWARVAAGQECEKTALPLLD